MNDSPRGTICVVDDDGAVRESTAALLEAAGYAVQSFATADDLLSNAGFDEAHCLLLDLNMPGMSGLSQLEILRTRGITIPAIVFTGNGEGLNARMTRAGVLTVLSKPVHEEELLLWIETALKQR
jgi:FixJ family two-component response regulator